MRTQSLPVRDTPRDESPFTQLLLEVSDVFRAPNTRTRDPRRRGSSSWKPIPPRSAWPLSQSASSAPGSRHRQIGKRSAGEPSSLLRQLEIFSEASPGARGRPEASVRKVQGAPVQNAPALGAARRAWEATSCVREGFFLVILALLVALAWFGA